MEKVNIFWFRRDLRFDDNIGLNHALKGSNPVLPIFIFDREILDELNDQNDSRVSFIHQRLSDLNNRLEKEHKSGIKFYYDTPEEVFKNILSTYSIEKVFTNRDYEPYALERDEQIKRLLQEKGVSMETYKDQVIFEPNEVLKDDGTPYLVYTPFSKKWLEKLDDKMLQSSGNALDQSNWFPESSKIISLESMGFQISEIQVDKPSLRKKTLDNYEAERNYPAKDITSRLGVHLRFGTVSIREIAKRAKPKSLTFLKELVWREFFMMILFHYPKVVSSNFKSKYDSIVWRNNKDDFEKWKSGETGFPLVDAGMRELKNTGFMHNRIRMLVASFLTKHLLIDWKWGEAYFAEKLLDYELASNNGNWQWAAGTGVDAQPYFRIFNPTSQIDKFDKNKIYIKKWIPEYGTTRYVPEMVNHAEARERALKVFKEAANS